MPVWKGIMQQMENLVFSLNATVPVFLMMILGLFFKKIGFISDTLADEMNKFVFLIPLPVLVFSDLATVDFEEVWNMKFVLFCFGATVISIAIFYGSLHFFGRISPYKENLSSLPTEAARTLLGIAFIQNIYGTAGMAPLMIIGSVPLYNMMAVLVLSLFRPGQNGLDRHVVKRTLIGIIKNPIIIGIVAGLAWSALRIPMPNIMEKTVNSVAGVATPMGLMAMGATFDIRKAFAKVKPAVAATLIKLVGFAAIFLPLAAQMGFRQEELVAILVMLGSATTVSCFVMARNMGHEGVLSSSVVMLTTLFSAFTLTGWLYVMKSLSLI